MASVLDVARYVITKKHPLTIMKMQKLVYYCQAWSLARDDAPLFPEEFEAWANGPVCPQLYERQKGSFLFNEDFLSDQPEYHFTEDELETMDIVLICYGDDSPEQLSLLVHSELPWKIACGSTPLGEPCRTVITKESMMYYYRDQGEKELDGEENAAADL